MTRPLDIHGFPVTLGAWYWAKNRIGQAVGVGKFLSTISRPDDISFWINGTGYSPESFAAFYKTDEPTFETGRCEHGVREDDPLAYCPSCNAEYHRARKEAGDE